MNGLAAVCVFCGSRAGRRPEYADAAAALGREIARRGARLVYGGGDVGLMKVVADACLDAGGEAIGVIPRFLDEHEVGHRRLTRLEVVETMHERKARLAELADAFVALPGGLGTLEELFELWTAGLLGLHGKPCGMLEVDGFYAPLLAFLDRLVAEGFLDAEHRAMLRVEPDAARLLDRLAAPAPPALAKYARIERF